MIDQWLLAIQELIVSAAGNTDEEAGELWDSTVTRLGADDEEDAAERIYFDLFEDADLAPERPFFVIVEADATWLTHGSNAWANGAIDVFYTEQTVDPDAEDSTLPVGEGAAHKRSKLHFTGWISNLMADCANRIGGDSPLKIDRIEQLVPAQRTPREFRDGDDPTRDYWWTCWRFHIGTGSM
jgi:hypothetical protein